MQNLQIKNQKLPAWIGSILFHAILVLLIIVWFSFSPSQKSGFQERFAIGGIALQAQTDAALGQSGGTPGSSHSQSTDADAAALVPEKFSNVSLDVLPLIPVLAPGQNVVSPVGTASAGDLMGGFGRGNLPGSGIGDGTATIKFWNIEGKGTQFVYVFDHSASMEGTPIRRAKEELIRSFSSLDEFHQFNIVFYNNKWQLWQPGRKLVFATPTEKELAARFVQGIPAVGGTWHFDPLKEAIEHRPDVIFFLTDGDAKDDPTLRLSELERLNNQRGFGAQINVVQFGSGNMTDPPSRALQQLAEQHHGQYQYINTTTLR